MGLSPSSSVYSQTSHVNYIGLDLSCLRTRVDCANMGANCDNSISSWGILSVLFSTPSTSTSKCIVRNRIPLPCEYNHFVYLGLTWSAQYRPISTPLRTPHTLLADPDFACKYKSCCRHQCGFQQHFCKWASSCNWWHW